MTTFKAIARHLLGTKYERLLRTLSLCLVVYWGLHMTGFRIQVAPAIRYLMVSTLSAGVMWQALSSESGGVCMKNMWMLPFRRRSLVFSYVGALGIYTFCTKTAWLLAVLAGVSVWIPGELLGSLLCGAGAVLVTAVVYSRKGRQVLGVPVAGAFVAVLLGLGDTLAFGLAILGGILLSLLLLGCTDAYAFCPEPEGAKGEYKTFRRHSLRRYLSRYLWNHKNYLFNTLAMWGVACVLPVIFGGMEGMFALPVGFGILSMNTPLGILLSCDPALERAVRSLPGQGKGFCVPYGCFLFGCNLAADGIFLLSWQLQKGGIQIQAVTGASVSGDMAAHALLCLALAVFFAMGSAVGSVLLEWFFPVRNWKVESDLWHHPRKYVAPGCLLLLAGIVGGCLAGIS